MVKTRTKQAPSAMYTHLAAPSVDGLEGGRLVARRRHRIRNIRNGIGNFVRNLVLLAVVAGLAWIGYSFYQDYQTNESEERERRIAELERDDSTLLEKIEKLDQQPRWNGPGNPAFGVGEEPEP